ncbi:MAG: OsmC family protein [Acidimicrobiia bacterium]
MTTTESGIEQSGRNGVDVDSLFATINVVKGKRELAKFQFRAASEWMQGTHSRVKVGTFDGAGGTHGHREAYSSDVDHPVVLTGRDNGPTPVEYLLVGLAGCLTAGIANIAAARGVTLRSVTADVEGDIDLQGILGLSNEVRNGYEQIRIRFTIEADAPAAKVAELVEQSRARSAVFDVLTNGVPVAVDVTAA